MFDRTHGVWRLLTSSSLVAIVSISVASAQSQPNPPTGLSVDDGAAAPDNPPRAGLLFSDDFNYIVNKFDSAATKEAAFTAAGWSGLKDETTQPGGARGYLSTVASIPGYVGVMPGGRALKLEGLPTSMAAALGGGNQTDFYLFYGTAGPVGRANPAVPGNVWYQFWIYVDPASRWASRNKLIYPSDDGMASGGGTENSYMVHIRPSNQAGVVQPYGPNINAVTHIEGASITSNAPDGAGRLGHNLTAAGHQLAGGWYLHKIHFDHSQPNGVYETWIRPMGGRWLKTAEWISGVTPGFTWITHENQRVGHNMFKMPTTWGTVDADDRTNYDATIYMDDFAMAASEADLPVYQNY
jgi:hypothetical protein